MNDSGLYKTVHNAAYVGTGEAHAWDGGTVTKEATCTEDGTMLYTCTIDQCGETMEAAIPATGHKWSEWTVTTPATEAEEGVETRTCSNCNETETRAIPRLESADNEEMPGLHVLDKEDADRSFGSERKGDTLTITSEYEQMTTLTGTGKAVRALAEQGVKMLVFVTPHGSVHVDAAALERLMGEGDVFRLVVTEESVNLWVNDALHNELLK